MRTTLPSPAGAGRDSSAGRWRTQRRNDVPGRHAARCASINPTPRGDGAAVQLPPIRMAHPTERKRQEACEES
jgi:hypothetical protein